MRDKTQDDRFFILTLFAIARKLVRTGSSSPLSQIDLAVGLLPEHYGVLKDRFANYFRRKDPIRFVYHDRPYMIAINHVLVFPQAYAAVIPNSDLVVKTARLFLVDIGGYTTDVLLLRYGRTVLTKNSINTSESTCQVFFGPNWCFCFSTRYFAARPFYQFSSSASP